MTGPHIAITDETLTGRHGALTIRRYAPAEVDGDATPLLWVHGGGFVQGSLRMLESSAVATAVAEAGRVVWAASYHLAPMWNIFRAPRDGQLKGNRFPLPVDDVSDAIRHVQERSPHGRFTLGGASAGACLTAAATLRLRDEGGQLPLSLVFAYGTFHATLPAQSPALEAQLGGKTGFGSMNPAQAYKMNRNYAGSPDVMDNPYAFPGGHDLSGLPRTLMIDAFHDGLRASGEAFSQELAAAGVPVDYSVVEGSNHGFLNTPKKPTFDVGISRITDWLTAVDRSTQS